MSKKKINWFLINENFGANLFPFGFHFVADYFGFKKEFGLGSKTQAVGIAGGHMRQAYDLDDYNAVAEHFYKMFCNNKRLAHKMLKNVYQIVKEFYDFNKNITKINLTGLTNHQLARLFKNFYDIFYEMSTWSVPFGYTEYNTPLWTNALTKYLTTLNVPAEDTTLEIFQILSDHPRMTYTAKEKEGILKLATEVKRSKKLSTIFKKSPREIINQLEKRDKDFLRKIKLHTKKFDWINYGFEGPLLDLEYFTTAIKDWAKKNPQLELNRIEKNRKTLNSRQKKLIKDLKIDAKHQWMFWVVKEFGFQKTYRKDIEYFSYYIYDTFLLKELGRRIGISANQGHYLMINEILNILSGKKEVDINELNERIKRNFYLIINGKEKMLTGKAAWDFDKKIKSRSVPKGLKKLKGQCACKGQAQGKVKIIKNKDDYSKFKTGDVLVSYATNPNMVPLMKRSSAIVTDEGGVTCHAAIVSRELDIPCIIGTRFATAVLKDGQRVSVDASNGEIRKI